MYGDATTFFTRGMIIPLDQEAPLIIFQWNPKYIQEVKTNKVIEIPVAGREQPHSQYGCGKARIFKFVMDLSKSNNYGSFVRTSLSDLRQYTKPLVKGQGVNRHPRCQIILGSFLDLKCEIITIESKYGEIYDNYTLEAKEALVELVIREYQ